MNQFDKKEDYSKREISNFIDKYLLKNVICLNILEDKIPLLNQILENAQDFERPDGYSVVNDDCYIIEHFEFDPYRQKKRSSQLREEEFLNKNKNEKIFESLGLKNGSGYFYKKVNSEIILESSKAYYINNLTRVFNEHSINKDEYIKRLKENGIVFKNYYLIFFIEDKTILGSYSYGNNKPFNIFLTKEINDLWNMNSGVDYVFLGLNGVNGCPCFFMDRLINQKLQFESIENQNIFITNRAQVMESQIFIPKQ